MSTSLTIAGLAVDLGGRRILDGVDLAVPAGSFVSLLGPSGSGKTTTLNVLAGFLPASAGEVLADGERLDRLPPRRRNVGFVFQDYALFPHMSVAANVEFPLRARRVPAKRRADLVAEALRLVHLPDAGPRAVRSLSGGQRQRIALARALVFGPGLLLLDEPLAALDKQLRETMQLELKRIQRETGTTTVAVTHDQVEALSMSDLVAVMDAGRIEQVGTPEEVYRRPATEFVARFLGEADLFPVVGGAVPALGRDAGGQVADGLAVIRPEDLALAATGPGPEVVVRTVTYQGTRLRVELDLAGVAAPVVVTLPAGEGAVRPAPGDRLHLVVPPGPLHVLPAAPAVTGLEVAA
ncbi:ABC transporter ATP-binding protein [Blastococcus sp. SYSU D00820]